MAITMTANALQAVRVLGSFRIEVFSFFVASFSSVKLMLIYFDSNRAINVMNLIQLSTSLHLAHDLRSWPVGDKYMYFVLIMQNTRTVTYNIKRLMSSAVFTDEEQRRSE